MTEQEKPYSEEEMMMLRSEGANHRAFFESKVYQDTEEKVGHSEHWSLCFVFDGAKAESIDGREDAFRYYYAYDDPTSIDTSNISQQDRIDTIHLDKAVPGEEGKQFDITESNTFDSDDPLTELWTRLQEMEESE